MAVEWLLLGAGLVLAFANGANDNPKGIATLHGAGHLDYPKALALATVSTAAGSLASMALAAELVRAFSGKGLIPAALLDASFLAAVAAAAACTVLVATRLGLPVSTTHAIVGALAGAGALLAGPELSLSALGGAFFLPLALGPLLAVGLAWALFRGASSIGRMLDLDSASCICVASGSDSFGPEGTVATSALSVDFAHAKDCSDPHAAKLNLRSIVDGSHLVSASAVGFARGLNDTPKILGLLVGGSAVQPAVGALAITLAMAIGGLVAARRVTQTLSHDITPMSHSQGLAGNVSTALLVLFASRFGLPVSTTHVSTGGIFGIGASSRTLRGDTTTRILGAWLGTLPLSALLGVVMAGLLR